MENVYIMSDRPDRVKIGMSNNPARRLREARTNNPEMRLVKVYRVADMGVAEKDAHARLAKMRTTKEFFSLAPAQAVKFMDSLMAKHTDEAYEAEKARKRAEEKLWMEERVADFVSRISNGEYPKIWPSKLNKHPTILAARKAYEDSVVGRARAAEGKAKYEARKTKEKATDDLLRPIGALVPWLAAIAMIGFPLWLFTGSFW